jgi:hypothetical protein
MTMMVKGLRRWLEDEPWPKCPYCLEPLGADDFKPEYSDLETDEIECSNCGRVYEIRAHVRWTFECHPKGEKP